ncbi:SR-related and CTD-associated factor 8 isoform X1 [Sorex fumeus]|uniref:SR-related and CTD-associated factor 8 isoform X1 n=1 Tax=Sorex fumeus TaxID=62283 RepID=UPI0024AD8296|nr:SR-related and CTD-associated factor 8 isoform X1 [Sorex fumeus]XP_055982352.1 SR-related and CTD-associated factor 8 isoform X1 [Sorex fumeus]XP_055982353.1 SR-related and CTD-associated factor 8 isoform X1 [Sorex fumeus]
MEAVKTFNSEDCASTPACTDCFSSSMDTRSILYSLNDYKPPISKAKMTQITKAAIKAIKFYKHVVQSVEKFIQKCKPEYKVPGLYVIDSIVRQSRHQFGQEKDVFAPRFSNNIISTFQNLYRCPGDDKSKIVRVLNLWQKNNVFKSEIIQPLLDMAAGIPPPVVTPVLASTTTAMSNTPGTPVTPVTPANVVQGLPEPWMSQITNTDTLAAVAQILQSPQGQQLQQLIQTLQIQQQKPQPSILQALDAGLVVQLQALTAQLTAAAAAANTLNPLEQGVSFHKKLMDRFDFGEDSEHGEEPKKELPASQLAHVSESVNNSIFHQIAEQLQQQNLEHLRQQLLEQQHPQKATPQDSQEGTFGSEHSASPSQGSSQQHFLEPEANLDDSIDIQQQDMDIDEGQDGVEEEIFEQEAKKVAVRSRSRTHSRSRSRSPRKRRSRSRSGSRKRKHRKRSRSRSRERKRKTSRSYSSERRAREREKERQKKGLPPVRSKTLSVCSTTLWVGQVDKKATQQDLTNLFEEFGQIESINMIPPRGCAYVCMVHRQDAFRALQKLSSGSYKIGSKVIKIAWALNKGVKTEYKQFWDVDLGVTYIPWEKVKVDDLEGFAEGGMIDQETVNTEWETVKPAEPVKEPVPAAQSPPPAEKEPVVTSQADVYPPPVAVLQIPVAPAVPAVSLVPPAFPVSMPVPPPGFSPIPPPPFLRASFNPSQPPPGFMPPPVPPPVVPPPAVPPVVPTSALVQPPLSMTPETVKDVGFGGLILPGASVAGSLATPTLPAGNVFNPPTKQGEPEDKVPHLLDRQISAGESARPVIPNDISSSSAILGGQPPNVTSNSGILGVQRPTISSNSEILGVRPANVSSSSAMMGAQPPNILSNSGMLGLQPPNVSNSSGLMGVLPPHIPNNPGLIGGQPPNVPNASGLMGTQPPAGPQNLPPLNIPGQRMPAMPILDIRPGLIPQTPGPRFPLIQPGIPAQRGIPPPSVLDSALHPPPRGPFPPGDMFSPPERPFLVPGRQSIDSVPNPDKRIPVGNENIQQEGDRDYRFPPMEPRESIRPPPLDVRDVVGRPVDPREGPGRPALDGREHFGRPVDLRENLVRPGLDHLGRRDHFGFNPEKPWGHRDFDEREHRVLSVFGGPKGLHEERGRFRPGAYRFDPRSGPWNRGFGQEVHRDFDDRRRPWERQRDRDDRDFDFCREINGNRLGRDRIPNAWAPPPHSRVFEFFEGATSQRKGDSVPQVNGENPERHAPPPPLPVQSDPELYEKMAPASDSSKEKSDTVADRESDPVVESTETEGT